MGFEKHCLRQGCTEYPAFGFRIARDGNQRWACLAHKDLLEFGSGVAAAASDPNAAREGVALEASLPLPSSLAQGRLI